MYFLVLCDMDIEKQKKYCQNRNNLSYKAAVCEVSRYTAASVLGGVSYWTLERGNEEELFVAPARRGQGYDKRMPREEPLLHRMMRTTYNINYNKYDHQVQHYFIPLSLPLSRKPCHLECLHFHISHKCS